MKPINNTDSKTSNQSNNKSNNKPSSGFKILKNSDPLFYYDDNYTQGVMRTMKENGWD